MPQRRPPGNTCRACGLRHEAVVAVKGDDYYDASLLGVHALLGRLSANQVGRVLTARPGAVACLGALGAQLRGLYLEHDALARGERPRRAGRPARPLALLRRLRAALERQRVLLEESAAAAGLPPKTLIRLLAHISGQTASTMSWLSSMRPATTAAPPATDTGTARDTLVAVLDGWGLPPDRIREERVFELASGRRVRWRFVPDPGALTGDLPGVEAYRRLLAQVKAARAASAPLCAAPDCGCAVALPRLGPAHKTPITCSPECAVVVRAASDAGRAERAAASRRGREAATQRREAEAERMRQAGLEVLETNQNHDKRRRNREYGEVIPAPRSGRRRAKSAG